MSAKVIDIFQQAWWHSLSILDLSSQVWWHSLIFPVLWAVGGRGILVQSLPCLQSEVEISLGIEGKLSQNNRFKEGWA